MHLKHNFNKTIVLGSGLSILNLSQKEIDYINQCEVKIAFNKYMLFYEKSKIIPNYIYFHDLYGYEAYLRIIEKCKSDKLDNLTFFVSFFLKNITYSSVFSKINSYVVDVLYFRIKALFTIFFKLNINCSIHRFILFRKFQFIKRPHNSKFIKITITPWNKGGEWAENLDEKIFHYRGSLTSVINICSIIKPSNEIVLIGTDFNSSKYFFQDELEQSKFKWKDYTYNITKTNNKHYSFIKVDNETMSDRFPYINEQLKRLNIKLTCTNPNSLLVKEGLVEYKPLLNYD